MQDTCDIYVWRFARKETYTIGKLYIDGKYTCDVCEDVDYGFDGNTPVSVIRQTKKEHPSAVAIPYGRYLIDATWARHFADKRPWYWDKPLGKRIPCLTGVPAYSGVLIHRGTNANHTAGCLLVGYNKVKGGLVDTDVAYIKVAGAISEANAQNKKTYITISPEKPDYASY